MRHIGEAFPKRMYFVQTHGVWYGPYLKYPSFAFDEGDDCVIYEVDLTSVELREARRRR